MMELGFRPRKGGSRLHTLKDYLEFLSVLSFSITPGTVLATGNSAVNEHRIPAHFEFIV